MRHRVRRLADLVGRPFRAMLIGLITLYRTAISPMFGPRCKYYPSCSAYALGAVQTQGAVKGVLLAGWRLLRCNPFSKGGYDPVPAPGRWLPDVHPDGRPRKTAASDADRPAHSASKET